MSRRAPQWHSRWAIILSLMFCLTLALAPSLAEARAGGGGGGFSGMGSRGLRSFDNNGAQPLTRSVTPSPQATSPLMPGGGSFFSRHPFLTGMFGGFLGSMLFGGGFFGHAFGGLFTLLIIGGLIYLAVRLFTGRGFSMAGVGMMPRSLGAAAAPVARYRGTDIAVGDADLSAFQSIHAAIQEAWSRGDLAQLRQLVTPEMVSYFSEELTRNSSQGQQNIVANVNLLKGELTESWEEGDMQYATAFMQWSALDYMVRLGASPSDATAVVSGNPRVATEAEEVWTFVRRRGAHWLLSAIQQV